MSLICGIFNSTSVETTETGLLRGNKAVDAAFFAALLSSLFRTGIMAEDDNSGFLSTVTAGTMKVVTSPGQCLINGYFAYDEAKETRTFVTPQSDRTVARVMRLDLGDGSIRVLWRDCTRQGDVLLSMDDNAALPVRGGNIFDLVTCVVDIPAGTTALTPDMVTDLRGDPTFCGWCGVRQK